MGFFGKSFEQQTDIFLVYVKYNFYFIRSTVITTISDEGLQTFTVEVNEYYAEDGTAQKKKIVSLIKNHETVLSVLVSLLFLWCCDCIVCASSEICVWSFDWCVDFIRYVWKNEITMHWFIFLKKNHMRHLPDDILSHIFVYVPPQWLCTCSRHYASVFFKQTRQFYLVRWFRLYKQKNAYVNSMKELKNTVADIIHLRFILFETLKNIKICCLSMNFFSTTWDIMWIPCITDFKIYQKTLIILWHILSEYIIKYMKRKSLYNPHRKYLTCMIQRFKYFIRKKIQRMTWMRVLLR
jgi:hypothetical protein